MTEIEAELTEVKWKLDVKEKLQQGFKDKIDKLLEENSELIEKFESEEKSKLELKDLAKES